MAHKGSIAENGRASGVCVRPNKFWPKTRPNNSVVPSISMNKAGLLRTLQPAGPLHFLDLIQSNRTTEQGEASKALSPLLRPQLEQRTEQREIGDEDAVGESCYCPTRPAHSTPCPNSISQISLCIFSRLQNRRHFKIQGQAFPAAFTIGFRRCIDRGPRILVRYPPI